MLLDFSELSNHFFSISDIFAVTQVNRGKTRFTMSEPRPTDALLFFASTTGVCYQQSAAAALHSAEGACLYAQKLPLYMGKRSGTEQQYAKKHSF